MKIGYLGAGTWGFCLAALLASNGHRVRVWARDHKLVEILNKTKEHPDLPGFKAVGDLSFTCDMQEAIEGSEIIIESVTSAGIRPVFESLKKITLPKCPIVITSKGIEQNSELLLSEVIQEILGPDFKDYIGCLSGPSHAEEVVKNLPTSVVASGYTTFVMDKIRDAFSNKNFRVYPNKDIQGVLFGAAMKNIIAIACGLSDGLGFGDNTKAALMTRGLHEIRKLSVVKGAKPQTLNGLTGMGDLCVTCLSTLSRNYRFGRLLAEGHTPKEAKEKINVAVEGSYTVVSAVQMGRHHRIDVPISEAIYSIIYEHLEPSAAVKQILQRATKDENL
jgi:glycerol-3-phosphate dehydrogenase (NAD(P)+)